MININNFLIALNANISNGVIIDENLEPVNVFKAKLAKPLGFYQNLQINNIAARILSRIHTNFEGLGKKNFTISLYKPVKHFIIISWKILSILKNKRNLNQTNLDNINEFQAHLSRALLHLKINYAAAKIQTCYQARKEGDKVREKTFFLQDLQIIQREMNRDVFFSPANFSPATLKDFSIFLTFLLELSETQGLSSQNIRGLSFFQYPDKTQMVKVERFLMQKIPPFNKEICFYLDFFIHFDKTHKKISIIFHLGKLLGSGGFKKIYSAKHFSCTQRDRTARKIIDVSPIVLAYVEGDEQKKDVCRGINRQERIYKQLAYKKYLAALPILKMFDPKFLILAYPWYNADFLAAINPRGIPLNIDSDKDFFTLSIADKMTVLLCVGKTLEYMHANGFVHRDVKATNILVKRTPKGLRGYLNDFDLCQTMGLSENKRDYPYWDSSSQNGFVMPSSDVYGFLICMGEAFFGFQNFKEFLFTREAFATKKYDDMLDEIIEEKVTKLCRNHFIVIDDQKYQYQHIKIDFFLQILNDTKASTRDKNLIREIDLLKKEIRILRINHHFIRSFVEKEKNILEKIKNDQEFTDILRGSDVCKKIQYMEDVNKIFPSIKQLTDKCFDIRKVLLSE